LGEIVTRIQRWFVWVSGSELVFRRRSSVKFRKN
jgi:hypothetical protein